MSSGGSGSTQRQVHPPAACADSGEDPDEIFFGVISDIIDKKNSQPFWLPIAFGSWG